MRPTSGMRSCERRRSPRPWVWQDEEAVGGSSGLQRLRHVSLLPGLVRQSRGSSEPLAHMGTLGGTFSLEKSGPSNPSFCSDCEVFLFRKSLLLGSSVLKAKNVESRGLILLVSRKVTEGCFSSAGARTGLFSVAAKPVPTSSAARGDAGH